jgi:hypothetical protein
MSETRRFWGVDLIAGLYAFLSVVLLCGALVGLAKPILGSAIISAGLGLIAIGMFLRINAVRILLIVILAGSLFLNVLVVMYYFDEVIGLHDTPAEESPFKMLLRTGVKLAIGYTMFRYLRRDDVRDTFLRPKQTP